MVTVDIEKSLLSDEEYREKYRKANQALIEIWVVNNEVANVIKDVLLSRYHLVGYKGSRSILIKNGVLNDYNEKFAQLVEFTLSLEIDLEQVIQIAKEYEAFKSKLFPLSPGTNEHYYFINGLIQKYDKRTS